MENLEKYIECECHSPEHTLKFTYDFEDKEIYTSVYLHQYHNIWQRILIAVKYLLGYQSQYGAFDCFLADKPKIKELRDFFNVAYTVSDQEELIKKTKKKSKNLEKIISKIKPSNLNKDMDI